MAGKTVWFHPFTLPGWLRMKIPKAIREVFSTIDSYVTLDFKVELQELSLGSVPTTKL